MCVLRDVSLLPRVDLTGLKVGVVVATSFATLEEFKVYKSTKAHCLISGFVHESHVNLVGKVSACDS